MFFRWQSTFEKSQFVDSFLIITPSIIFFKKVIFHPKNFKSFLLYLYTLFYFRKSHFMVINTSNECVPSGFFLSLSILPSLLF